MKCAICKVQFNDALEPALAVSLRAQGLDIRGHIIDEKTEFRSCQDCYAVLKSLIAKGRKQ